jgi:hypothetical protein
MRQYAETDSSVTYSRSIDNILFYLQFISFIGALFMDGFGNIMFGNILPTNVSTMFVLLALVLHLVSGKFRLPVFLLILYAYIAIQTFIFNFTEITLSASIMHFVGLILFSITSFSFVSAYRNRMIQMIQMYYKFCFVIACIAIIQTIMFVMTGVSLSLQQMLGGPSMAEMAPEILGILPRSIGTASEPATYAVMLIPGMFVSLLVLLGRGAVLDLNSKIFALVVFAGFILSFSLIGFIGLGLSIGLLSLSGFWKSRFIGVLVAIGFVVGGIIAVSNLTIGAKLTSLASMSLHPTEFNYTTSDLSGFALVSNVLVAQEGLSRSNYLGTGLNTHATTYEDVIPQLFDKSQVIFELNKNDAGSLFIRLTSEFGVPGLLFLILFLLRYKLRFSVEYSVFRIINDLCFVVLIIYSARNGSYLSVILWLFSAMYFYSYKAARNQNGKIINMPKLHTGN